MPITRNFREDTRQTNAANMKTHIHRRHVAKSLLHAAFSLNFVWMLLVGAPACFSQTNTDADKETNIAALKKERDDAIEQVKKIVNQPVPRFARQPGMRVLVETYDPGAPTPDFDHVDVRQTQQLLNATQPPFVTCSLASGIVFRSADTEFNEMTKYFIINRSVPKKKLTESEMLEINRLYRIIGKCRKDLFHLQAPPVERPDTAATETESESNTESAPVREPVPRENYIKAAIGVSAVLLIYVLFLLLRRLKSS